MSMRIIDAPTRAGAASREAEFSARQFDLACEVYRRDEVSRQWFVADDLESGIERRHADRVMTVIWRHYGDYVRAVTSPGLVFNQCLPR